ncbi:MAG: thymidine phosphorylase [Bryobacteraceae bacterium]|nr:thymidine phosphorylase [Bryobacteraceae bacterium]
MHIVELIQRKRDGEELTADEITSLFEGYIADEIPERQMAAFLMAVYFSGLSDREVSALTACLLKSGKVMDLSNVPGAKVEKHSTGGVGDKTSLIAAPLAAASGVVVPMVVERAVGYMGGTQDKLEAIPGFRTDLSMDEFRSVLNQFGLAFIRPSADMAPADRKLRTLRQATATEDSLPLIAASVMANKMSSPIDALILDVKVGGGGAVKRQVEARKLAQLMVGVGRRMNKRVQALITDMSQPLGYAIGNALEIMEVSQTLQNVGPADLTRLSLELAARMIFLAGITANMEEGREMAQSKLLDGSGYRRFREVIDAQGGNPQVLDRFDLLPNATGAREITSPRAGYISAIDAEDIGYAAGMIGGSRMTDDGVVDPAVGVILEVKVGQKIDEGAVLCRLYYTQEEGLDDAAQSVEDAFRISTHRPDERELILEVVG